MFKSLSKRGFTIIELLVVLSVLVIVIVSLVSGFQSFARFQQYRQAVSDVDYILNQARLSARAAEMDSAYGVKISANSITQFIGDTYSVSDPNNKITTYNMVNFTLDLTGGSDEIVFAKLNGLPNATGTIEVAGIHYLSSTTIEITASGIVQ